MSVWPKRMVNRYHRSSVGCAHVERSQKESRLLMLDLKPIAVAVFNRGAQILTLTIGVDVTRSNGHVYRTIEQITTADGATVRTDYGDGTDRYTGIVEGYQKRLSHRLNADWSLPKDSKAHTQFVGEAECRKAIKKADEKATPKVA